jgi:RNA polymerase sigma-70 factor (ECF subfamily)
LPLGDEAFRPALAAAKTGAEWAWSVLFRDLWGPVAGYLANQGSIDPEDTASDVFLKVARAIHDFEGDEASFRSWVFVIAHRSLIDQRRRASRRPDLSPMPEDVHLEAGNVEDEAVNELVTGELLEVFGALTDDQRDVLALRMIGGLTLEQTAHVLGKSSGAVKALQRRALAAVQGVLEDTDVTL